MTGSDYLQIAILLTLLILLAIPFGRFMARVYANEDHFLLKALSWLERILYKLCGIDSQKEMDWRQYTSSLLLFNAFGFIVSLSKKLYLRTLILAV